MHEDVRGRTQTLKNKNLIQRNVLAPTKRKCLSYYRPLHVNWRWDCELSVVRSASQEFWVT